MREEIFTTETQKRRDTEKKTLSFVPPFQILAETLGAHGRAPTFRTSPF